MSTLEELLYQRLTGDTTLSAMLTTFGGAPAVFEFYAPPDTDPGWSGAQSPRVEFYVTRQEDPERRVAGQVSVSILHRAESAALVADIEARVRALLDGATFRPDEGTVTLQWARIDPFDQYPDYRGVEAVYDLIAWPSGLTYTPDPVQALRSWTAAKWTNIQVDPETWSPNDTNPALYWRMANVAGVQPIQWGAWIDGVFHGHVLANSPSVRVEWIRRVVEGLALDRRVLLDDGSKLFLQRIAADSNADPLRTGQIRLVARFGVLAPAASDPILQSAYISGDANGEVT